MQLWSIAFWHQRMMHILRIHQALKSTSRVQSKVYFNWKTFLNQVSFQDLFWLLCRRWWDTRKMLHHARFQARARSCPTLYRSVPEQLQGLQNLQNYQRSFNRNWRYRSERWQRSTSWKCSSIMSVIKSERSTAIWNGIDVTREWRLHQFKVLR